MRTVTLADFLTETELKLVAKLNESTRLSVEQPHKLSANFIKK